MRTHRILQVALAAAACIACGAAEAATAYRVIEPPLLWPPDTTSGSSSAAINKHGVIGALVWSQLGGSVGYRCDKFNCEYIPPLYIPHWPFASVGGMNDAGVVAGTSADIANTTHAYYFDGVSSHAIGGLPDDYCGGCANDSYGNDVNNQGQVVGSAFGVDGRERAFVWSASTGVQELGTLGGGRSVATAINDRGDLVGYASTAADTTHAFIIHRGKMRDLGHLGGDWAQAYALNEARQVVGCSKLAGGEVTQAFSYVGGVMTALPSLGGSYACASGVNGNGQVVGVATTSSGEQRGFLVEGGAVFDLNELLVERHRANWTITAASAISDKGLIAATGVNRVYGTTRALILKPREATAAR